MHISQAYHGELLLFINTMFQSKRKKDRLKEEKRSLKLELRQHVAKVLKIKEIFTNTIPRDNIHQNRKAFT